MVRTSLGGSHLDRPGLHGSPLPPSPRQATFLETKKKPPSHLRATCQGRNGASERRLVVRVQSHPNGAHQQRKRARQKRNKTGDPRSGRRATEQAESRRRAPAGAIHVFTRHNYQSLIGCVTAQPEQIDASRCQEAARRASQTSHSCTHTHNTAERGEERGPYLVGTYFGNKR